jgi:NADH-quinone oxidoreductase subunit I
MGLGNYIKTVFSSIKSLATGMKLTGYYFSHHKEILTQEYPENKDSLNLPERFRGEVIM